MQDERKTKRKRRTLRGTDDTRQTKQAKAKVPYERIGTKFLTAIEIFAGMAGGNLVQNGLNSMLSKDGATPSLYQKVIVSTGMTLVSSVGSAVYGGDNSHIDNLTTGMMVAGMKQLGETVVGKDITNINFQQKVVANQTQQQLPQGKDGAGTKMNGGGFGEYNEDNLEALPDDYFLDNEDLTGDENENDDFAEDVEFED